MAGKGGEEVEVVIRASTEEYKKIAELINKTQPDFKIDVLRYEENYSVKEAIHDSWLYFSAITILEILAIVLTYFLHGIESVYEVIGSKIFLMFLGYLGYKLFALNTYHHQFFDDYK